MVSIIRTKCCHVPLISASNERSVVYFDCSWSRKQMLADNMELLNLLEENGFSTLYHIADEFCDEVESFVIEKGAKSFPCLAIYEHGEMSHFSSGLGDLTNVSRVLSGLGSPSPALISQDQIKSLSSVVHSASSSQPARLFISGDRSSVGKSTCCLLLLAALVHAGVKPDDLAYIKPITQCEADQPVVKFCTQKGIANRGIGPVVFYKGFTRAFLDGNTDTTEQLLASVVQSVEEIELGKKLVIIDGVGYPAVGSICGISNADAAKALDATVLLVGKSGVGDAVDSFNLNARFFEYSGVRVLGGIFNKIALEGFYNVESCRSAVTSYFDQYRPTCKAYGFVPVMTMESSSGNGSEGTERADSDAEVVSPASLETFLSNVAVRDLIGDALNAQFEEDCKRLSDISIRGGRKSLLATPSTIVGGESSSIPMDVSSGIVASASAFRNAPQPSGQKRTLTAVDTNNTVKKRSRAEIEAEARSRGAKGG